MPVRVGGISVKSGLLLPVGQPGLAVAALVVPLDRCAFGQAEASDEQQPGQFFGNSLNEIATHS